jgi:hypothetical protein
MTPYRIRRPAAAAVDPVERWVPLALKLILYFFLGFILYQAATSYDEYHLGKHWGSFLSIFRMFTFLPIHEAGHLFFRPFGWTMMILGGSFLQIAIPLLWFVLALFGRWQTSPFALFWVGENMMDVSLYMRDAPVRMLPLLGGDTSGHDWFNLFRHWNMLESADVFADVMFYGGFVISLAAIVIGIGWAFLRYSEVVVPAPVTEDIDAGAEEREIETRLNRSLENRERFERLD